MHVHFAAVALPGPASRRSWPKAARTTLVRFACSAGVSRSRLRHGETGRVLIF
ncbi:hypothetical protein FIBSPDRAFT_875024 [Athelia psychrophila]|uniref:Uncharacterized protein n=1 Tax=Athelia psychrophila TaxID=1759441 RepID=A0A165WRK5_9AGAM|nr:hypothetical protein FIBSPDRAFT_875024 [Fibularhizoctonia sp. CBS 109695]